MTCGKSEILNRRDVCFISASSDNGWAVNFEWVQQTHKQDELGCYKEAIAQATTDSTFCRCYLLAVKMLICVSLRNALRFCVTVSGQKLYSPLILFISVWQNDMKVYLLLKSLKHRCTLPKRFSFSVCQSLKPALCFGIWTSAFKRRPNTGGALVCPQNVMSAVLSGIMRFYKWLYT